MTITPDLLTVGGLYSRKDLAEVFDEPELAGSREGLYTRDRYDFVPFFVTLDKEHADPSVAYSDYFEDGLFFWESQNSSTPRSKWMVKIIGEEVTPLLFVREHAKVKGVTQEFVYAGRLVSPIHDSSSSKPVKFIFEPIDIPEVVPATLRPLLAWKPGTARKPLLRPDFAQRVARKRVEAKARGQGLESDPKVRKAIEDHAMLRITRLYERNGYEVEDVSANRPYDLICRKPGKRERRVEVKGTRGDGSSINLTAGEVVAANESGVITDLAIVYGIDLDASGDTPLASGGTHRVIQRWRPDARDLEPTQYRYTLPAEGNESITERLGPGKAATE